MCKLIAVSFLFLFAFALVGLVSLIVSAFGFDTPFDVAFAFGLGCGLCLGIFSA